jgi:hypothetical protein
MEHGFCGQQAGMGRPPRHIQNSTSRRRKRNANHSGQDEKRRLHRSSVVERNKIFKDLESGCAGGIP